MPKITREHIHFHITVVTNTGTFRKHLKYLYKIYNSLLSMYLDHTNLNKIIKKIMIIIQQIKELEQF